jgi:FKBP-type peptidyl-prolyl cis-trans isomerase
MISSLFPAVRSRHPSTGRAVVAPGRGAGARASLWCAGRVNRRTAPRLLLTLAAAVSLAACGSDDEPTSSAGPTTAAATTQACATAPATAAAPAEVSADLGVAPEVPATDAAPPCDLQVSDVVVGTGAAAAQGSAVAVKYVGAFYGTGEQFDSSWSRGDDETLPVTVGAGRVIPGFDRALDGMQVGGRRMVVIPSDLGYGPAGQGPIPGGATLVFVIDLVSVG